MKVPHPYLHSMFLQIYHNSQYNGSIAVLWNFRWRLNVPMENNHVFGYCKVAMVCYCKFLNLNHTRFLLRFFAFQQRPQANGLLMILWFVMHASFFSIIPPLMSYFDHDHLTSFHAKLKLLRAWSIFELSVVWRSVNSKYQTTSVNYQALNLNSSVKGGLSWLLPHICKWRRHHQPWNCMVSSL